MDKYQNSSIIDTLFCTFASDLPTHECENAHVSDWNRCLLIISNIKYKIEIINRVISLEMKLQLHISLKIIRQKQKLLA